MPGLRVRSICRAAAIGFALAVVPAISQGQGVIVNAVPLTVEAIRALQRIYPVSIAPGRYWYDPVSGLYGIEGAPASGQMMAGLKLGGALRPDASRGTMPVFINGRQLTQGEVRYLTTACRTQVRPGRYWVMASGVGGFEGGPPIFNLAQCSAPGSQSGGRGGGSSSRTWCDANGACTTSGILGSITTAPR